MPSEQLLGFRTGVCCDDPSRFTPDSREIVLTPQILLNRFCARLFRFQLLLLWVRANVWVEVWVESPDCLSR